MCRKLPDQCKAKVKCKCCKECLAIKQEDGKLTSELYRLKFVKED